MSSSAAPRLHSASLAPTRKGPLDRAARRLTDAVARCEYCGQASVETEFVHRMPAGEFLRRFAGKEVPTKYLTYRENGKSILIEIEE